MRRASCSCAASATPSRNTGPCRGWRPKLTDASADHATPGLQWRYHLLTADGRAGSLSLWDNLGAVTAVQPGVFNLAVRMLGHREDAEDACQEILVKVVTRLGSFRGEARFSTWVWSIARHHLLTAARTRARETPEVSFDEPAARLGEGLAFGRAVGRPATLTPADQAQAREVALHCTQGMLLRLDRGHRLAYLLDAVFGLPGEQAAAALGIAPTAYRQRLSRARRELHRFAQTHCGLLNPESPCRCERQLPAVREVPPAAVGAPLCREGGERAEAELLFDRFLSLKDTAALFRAHPAYQAPAAMRDALQAALGEGGVGWMVSADGAGPRRADL